MNTYEKLTDFITQSMSMAHIYQPVMLIELLKKGGTATTKEIAQAILNRDPSQIEYYSKVVTAMPGKVLTKNRNITEKIKGGYVLPNASELTSYQIEELVTLCERKIQEYERKRDGAHWEHRRRNRQPISGSIRYEVLKRAKGRCELCGISNEERSLEVDHIHPKSLGGTDDLINFQALCYTCNAQKRNTDNEDFRLLKDMYSERSQGCLFCDVPINDPARIVIENELAYAIRDGFAVTEGHTLVIPKRHTKDYFGLTQPELNAINQILKTEKNQLERSDQAIEGFNIGMNCGEVAGQTIFHCHVHLIPRREGDVENPRGGIRHVIPNKGFYKA